MHTHTHTCACHRCAQVEQGLPLQDFIFHCLRHCYVVVMTARDEAASFKIFSTLNGRGMDLAAVDKLKADLMQVGGRGLTWHHAGRGGAG